MFLWFCILQTTSMEDCCDEGPPIVLEKAKVNLISTPLNKVKSDFVDPLNTALLPPEYKHVNFCDSEQNSTTETHPIGSDMPDIYSSRQNCSTPIHTQSKKQRTFAVTSNHFNKFQVCVWSNLHFIWYFWVYIDIMLVFKEVFRNHAVFSFEGQKWN